MSAATSAGMIAAAAAARRRRAEEEELTPYTPQDLAQDWEFKILRSATGAFKDSHKLQQFLEEERQAGWVLVEKFDNGRIRLKRPASARERDGKLAIDPYRTVVGTTEGAVAAWIVLITVVVSGAILGAIVALASAMN